MNSDASIYVAGHRGLAGSAVLRALHERGFTNLVTRSSDELDLSDQSAVNDFFSAEKPEYVFLAAAKVGGIMANDTYPADFIRINLQIQTNVIDAAWRNGCKKLCFLGSSCIYPKFARQPMSEDELLAGPLEPTNEPYAIAKIAGVKMCQSYRRQYGFDAICAMPTNLYGPGDNFDLQTSHVLPALIHRFDAAKRNGDASVSVWGSGRPRREFLFVDDLADALCFLMDNYSAPEIINVGVGEDVSIADLAELVGKIVGFSGEILFDPGKPDGTPRKLLDVSRLQDLGWRATTGLEAGIRETYHWFLEHYQDDATR
jgi:GDP-L-fucose synthase